MLYAKNLANLYTNSTPQSSSLQIGITKEGLWVKIPPLSIA